MHISAKEGTGLEKLFAEIIERSEPPSLARLNPDEGDKLDREAVKCFLFGARFVQSRGVACFIKVMSGQFNHEAVRQLMSFHNKKRYEIYEVGVV